MSDALLTPDATNAHLYRAALGAYATGVAVITVAHEQGGHEQGAHDQGALGMTVNSFTSVSLDPPLVLWCLGDSSDRGVHFRPATSFVVNILGADQQAVADRCAKRGQYQFEHHELDWSHPGRPALKGALTRLWCDMHQQVVLGDHIAIVGKVVAFDTQAGDGLGYFRGRYSRNHLQTQV
jgi:flavin reductase (DIM6/NTAB) family NADH-FMN oxidoreductase RutF